MRIGRLVQAWKCARCEKLKRVSLDRHRRQMCNNTQEPSYRRQSTTSASFVGACNTHTRQDEPNCDDHTRQQAQMDVCCVFTVGATTLIRTWPRKRRRCTTKTKMAQRTTAAATTSLALSTTTP